MKVDEIHANGVVHTMDRANSTVEAFAVSGGRFCFVGSNAEVLKLAGRGTEVHDLGGGTVLPGFIETHSHLSLHAITLLQANCRTPPNATIEDVKARLRESAADKGPGHWVRGWGFDDTLIQEKRHLTRRDLDEAVPHHPVYVSHTSGHLAYVNSPALRLAGIASDTPQPDGGEIHLDPGGEPSGLLAEEPAQRLVLNHIPPYPVSELRESMAVSMRAFHKAGITSIHDAAIGYFRQHKPILEAYRHMEASGRLHIRVYLTLVEEVYGNLLEMGLGTGFGSEFLKLGAVKLFQDGSIQARTAALSQPYLNSGDHRGEFILGRETLDELVLRYHRRGIQVAVHANGDRAVESVLDAVERAQRTHPRRDARHMIIHCQLARESHIRRMKEAHIIPSYFVNHVYYWGDRHVSLFLGPERAKGIDPLASTVAVGLPFTLHSDLPVTPVDPLFSIHCAVNRLTKDGRVLGPDQRIPPLEAVKAYTSHAAACSFEEDLKGSIESGKLADFVVLSGSPMRVPPESIKDIQVLKTVVGGRTVFARERPTS